MRQGHLLRAMGKDVVECLVVTLEEKIWKSRTG